MPETPSAARRIAIPGRGLVPADTPILRGDDLGVLRGDGIFETMHVREGKPWLFDEHLSRMAASAVRLDLDLPSRTDIDELATAALAGWPVEVEAALRIVCTRGAEGGGTPVTFFATVAPVADNIIRARQNGITVATASLGFPAYARQRAPWLLAGAKTLSYAVNMASGRWAAQHGVDDVLWISGDAYALEGPTSTLIWLTDETLWTVPAVKTGILAGITARWLMDNVGALGWSAGERMVTTAQLFESDGVWLTSSVRGAAEILAIDGVDMPRAGAHTDRIQKLLGFAA